MRAEMLRKTTMRSGVLDDSEPFGGEKSGSIAAERGPDRETAPMAAETDRDTEAACRDQFAIACVLSMLYIYH
jgi:hypothetical protein